MCDDVYTLIVLYIVLYIYIPIKGTISVSKTETAAAGASNYKKVIIIVINFSILLKNLLQTHLKLLQKRIIRKATEAIVFLLVKKISNN